jgi:hypothetical protein
MAICGYCAMGSDGMQIPPASTIKIEQTAAKIGRLMKKSTNMTPFARE